MRITLSLEFESEELLKALRKSLAPDDKDLPKNVNLSSYVKDTSLIYTVDAVITKRADILTLCNVIDDILKHTKLVLTVLKNIS